MPCLPCPYSPPGWSRLGPRSSGSPHLKLLYKAAGISLAGLHSHSTSNEGPERAPFALWLRAPAYNLPSLHLFPTAGMQNAQYEVDGEIPGLEAQNYWCNNRFQLSPFLLPLCHITATQNQEKETSVAQWNYRDREYKPWRQKGSFDSFHTALQPRLSVHGPSLQFSITGLQHTATPCGHRLLWTELCPPKSVCWSPNHPPPQYDCIWS